MADIVPCPLADGLGIVAKQAWANDGQPQGERGSGQASPEAQRSNQGECKVFQEVPKDDPEVHKSIPEVHKGVSEVPKGVSEVPKGVSEVPKSGPEMPKNEREVHKSRVHGLPPTEGMLVEDIEECLDESLPELSPVRGTRDVSASPEPAQIKVR